VGREWTWRQRHGVGFWRIGPLEAAGCVAFFSSRRGGVSAGPWAALNLGGQVGDDAAAVAANRRALAQAVGVPVETWARVRQVHGAEVVAVRAPGDHGAADGLVSATPGLCLTVTVADCCAVYLLDPRRRVVGLCHAGWRGTVADVAGATVAAMVQGWGCRPEDLLAAVSPAVGPCCYEVDAPVIAALRQSAPWADRVLRAEAASPARARLDLWGANVQRLVDAGVPPAGVAVAGLCTACSPDLLYSHRRDGGRTGRMLAGIGLPPDA
jgi:YfiH family protein